MREHRFASVAKANDFREDIVAERRIMKWRIIVGQPLRTSIKSIVVVLFLVMLSDGYDLQSIGFAAQRNCEDAEGRSYDAGAGVQCQLVSDAVWAPLLVAGGSFGRSVAI